jgi:polar amino acid transport system permease protein
MNEGMPAFYSDLLEQSSLIYLGLWATIKLTVVISITGFLLGVVIFFLGLSANATVRRLVEGYKSFFIGTPLVCIIYILYYGLPALGLRLSPFEVLVLGFTLNVGAYNAGYLLTAYNGLDKSQLEAAVAQGFKSLQIYAHIILPQLLKSSTPALTNQVIYNLKDSSIAFLVQYPEFFARIQELAAGNFDFFRAYLFAAIVYLILTTAIFLLAQYIERRNHWPGRR